MEEKELVTTTETVAENSTETEKKERLFTRAELNKILATEKEKAVQEEREKMEEAERLKQMTVEEREKEKEKENQKLLAKKEKDIARREMKLEAINVLSEKELPISLVSLVVSETAEETNSKIDLFEKEFAKAVEKAVTDRLKGRTPKEPQQSEPKYVNIKRTF